MVAVPRRDRRGVVALGQLLARVLADRVEHEVARAVVAFDEHHERLLDQRLQQVEHVRAGERLDAAHRFGRGEIEAADEHAEPVEHDLLFGREQLIRPVDEGAQGLLPLLQDARAAGQQLVAVLQAGIDVGDGERADARRGELERQRDPFQARDQLGHRRRFALGEREGGLVLLRAFDEQAHGRRSRQRLEAVVAPRHRQRQHRIALLARRVQRLAARRQDAHVRRRLDDGAGHLRRRLDHVLAVVEDQQGTAVPEVRAHRLQQRLIGLLAHAEHLRRLR